MSWSPQQQRLVRGGVFGAVVWMLTLLGHAAAGGGLPGFGGLLVVFVLAMALGSAVAGRRRHVPMLVFLLLAGQSLMHTVLSVTSHAHATSVTGTMLVSHIAVAVIAAVIIDRGEGLAARWLAYLAQAIGGVDLASVPHRPRTVAASGGTDPLAFAIALEHHVVRRGPPLRSALSH